MRFQGRKKERQRKDSGRAGTWQERVRDKGPERNDMGRLFQQISYNWRSITQARSKGPFWPEKKCLFYPAGVSQKVSSEKAFCTDG